MSTPSFLCHTSSPRLRQATTALLVLACWSLVGCGTAGIIKPPRENIVMAGKQGEPIDPATYKRLPEVAEDAQTYDQYIDEVFSSISCFCTEKKADGKKPCRLLMYFHGGLDTPDQTVQLAKDASGRIKSGDGGFYPIFVNWRASLSSTYWDHLAHVHKGFYYRRLTVPFFPYVFLVDEGKSLADVLSTWGTEARHTFTHERLRQATDAYRNLLNERQGSGKGTIDLNCLLTRDGLKDHSCDLGGDTLVDNRTGAEKLVPGLRGMFTFWPKLLTLPTVVAAGGPGAWSVLERRTETLFRTEAEFRGKSTSDLNREKNEPKKGKDDPETVNDTAGAALAHFINRFQAKNGLIKQLCESGRYDPKKAAEKTAEPSVDLPLLNLKTEAKADSKDCMTPLEITLVGHSMGTIIIDRLLRYAPKLDVKNIVFMAAATTIEDYKDTIDPYLASHPQTQMFHLMLHPQAEVAENHVKDMAPRGSLLVWLDNFFTDPSDPLGRRVGRFANLLPELTFTPEEIQGQIHIKVFRVGPSLGCWSPQEHGDFSGFPFWDERFWSPEVDSGKGSPVPRWADASCSPTPRKKEPPCKKVQATPLTAPGAPSAASRH
jgi:hypothetical protein